jgi:hypothetical protein
MRMKYKTQVTTECAFDDQLNRWFDGNERTNKSISGIFDDRIESILKAAHNLGVMPYVYHKTMHRLGKWSIMTGYQYDRNTLVYRAA